ncbi:hypothetical protein N0V94_005615 [Neodidymelliopsis sp. IMI 364377]|nr:hypothetical protein N0V94_005615 [Neodidymelliopsis sp. IMI 364377]
MAQQVFDIYEKNGEKMDFNWGDVQQESFGALFAGSDTTAISFRSLFYHLMHNPDVYDRLEKEVDEAVKEGRMSMPPTYKQASQLPYLSACIKEALRIHPGAQLSLPRTVPKGGLELCGQFIPEGYIVGINAAVMHFDQGVFGQDADSFIPDRWMDSARANHMDKYLMSFGGGTRTCVGKNIALIELYKLSPQLVWNYRFQFYDSEKTQWHTRNTFFARQEGQPRPWNRLEDCFSRVLSALGGLLNDPTDGRIVLMFVPNGTDPLEDTDVTSSPNEIFGKNVYDFSAKTPVMFLGGGNDSTSEGVYGWPNASLSEIEPGSYNVQAFLTRYEMVTRSDGSKFSVRFPYGDGGLNVNGFGSLITPATNVEIYAGAQTLELTFSNITSVEVFTGKEIGGCNQGNYNDTETLKHIKIRSKKLSKF